MAERLKAFLKDVSTLRAQQRAEQLAWLDRLKAMTPQQFVRVPREELHDLTDRQYAEIVRHIAPAHRLLEPQETAQRKREPWAILRKIMIPTAVRAAVLGLLTGLPVLIASFAAGPAIDWWQYRTPPLRSQDASTWPPCQKLNGWVDGCIYAPAQDMAWSRAADLLQIPASELRQSNRHITAAYIPRHATLVVWRHRSPFNGSAP
jgi:hypothetical protein